MSKSLVIVTRPHRFIFNIGYQSVEITTQYLMVQLALELFVEFAVDGIAVYKEIFKQNLPLGNYFSMLTMEIFLAYVSFANAVMTGALLCFLSTPDAYFCKSADPCTCTGGSYRLYTSACAFINAPSETQEMYYNGTMTLENLPPRYITNISNTSNPNKTSYILNSQKMSNEHKSIFDAVNTNFQNAVVFGVITVTLIVVTMKLTNKILRFYGFDKEDRKRLKKKVATSALVKSKEHPKKRVATLALAKRTKILQFCLQIFLPKETLYGSRIMSSMQENQEDFSWSLWKNVSSELVDRVTALEEQGKLIDSAVSTLDGQGKRVSLVEQQQYQLSTEIERFRGLLRRRGLINGQLENIQRKGKHELEDVEVEEEEEKPQTIGTVVKTMFFVYLYATLIGSITTLLFAYLMTAKFTDWSGKKYGVPIVDLDIFIYQFYYPAFSIATAGWAFHIASFWESGIKEDPDSKLFPYGLLEGFCYIISSTTVIMGIQYPMWHYGKIDLIFWGRIDFILIVGGLIGGMLSAAKLRDIVFQCLNGKSSEDVIKEKMKIHKRRRSSQIDLSAIKDEVQKEGKGKWIVIISGIVCTLYPLFLMKAYNSDNIHDAWRVFFVTIVHPVISEIILLSLRNGKNDVKSAQFSEKLYLQNQAHVFWLELFLQLVRRIMVGCMQYQLSVYIALALMSLEEGIMRSTFLERDAWFRRQQNLPPITKGEERKYRQIIAVNIVNQMIVEVICIILSKSLVIVSRPHRFIFNLGYQSVEITTQSLLIQLGLELFVEFAVDGIAAYKEIFKQNLPLGNYFSLLTIETFLSYFTFANNATAFILICFLSTPDAFFCRTADPCTCNGGSYRLYTSACAFVNAPIEIQEMYFNGTMTLVNLPQKYMTTVSNTSNPNETSYILNSQEMSNEHKSMFDSVSAEIQSAVVFGLITVSLIFVAMNLTNKLLRSCGLDTHHIKKRMGELTLTKSKEHPKKRGATLALAKNKVKPLVVVEDAVVEE
eukprot:g583.t1